MLTNPELALQSEPKFKRKLKAERFYKPTYNAPDITDTKDQYIHNILVVSSIKPKLNAIQNSYKLYQL